MKVTLDFIRKDEETRVFWNDIDSYTFVGALEQVYQTERYASITSEGWILVGVAVQ